MPEVIFPGGANEVSDGERRKPGRRVPARERGKQTKKLKTKKKRERVETHR